MFKGTLKWGKDFHISFHKAVRLVQVEATDYCPSILLQYHNYCDKYPM